MTSVPVRVKNPSKVEALGYYRHEEATMRIGGGTSRYRKHPDSELFSGFGINYPATEQSVTLPSHPKHGFFKSRFETEYLSISENPTPGRRSYQLAMDETFKVVGYGADAAGGRQYPHGAS